MKRVFLLLALLFSSAVCFTACNSGPSVQGEFNSSSFVLSVDETINFYDEFSVKRGASLDDITFSSSNEQILSPQDDGNFIGLSSGRVIIFANYNNKSFAQANVIVKYQFSTPTQINIDSDGVLTWSPSYAQSQGEMVQASKYLLEYADITGNESPNIEDLEFARQEVENRFLFDTGSYYVRLTALGEEDRYVDSSNPSSYQIINVGVMGIVENLTMNTSTSPLNYNTTISWQEKESGLYDVYLNGILIYENLEENSFSYNFDLTGEDDTLRLRIIAKDASGILLPTATSVEIGKLTAPVIEYQSDGESYIYFDGIDHANSYTLYINNLVLNTQYYQYLDSEMIDPITFEGMAGGLYRINVTSIGGNNDGLYLNSAPSEDMLVAKLDTPNVEISFEDDNAILNFSETSYQSRYLVSWADKTQIVTGQSAQIDLSDLASDNYTFTIKAIPSFEDGEVIPYELLGQSTQIVIASDEFTYEFSILGDITGVTHALEEDNISLFGFNEVNNANFYQIYVNNIQISSANIDIQRGYVYIRINNLSNIAPIENQYNITIVAGRNNESGQEIAPRKSYSKTLSILDIVSESDEQTNGYFTWNTLDNPYVYYQYEIFSADETYNVTSEEPIYSGGTSENRTVEELDYGYYVIRIYSISTDKNNYLDSNFYDSNNYFEGNFLVYQQIESPNVTFSDENGYKLNITSTEFTGSFEIFIDDNEEPEGTLPFDPSLEIDEVVYNIINQFEEARRYTISVVATAGDEYDGNLHTNSQPTILYVTRLDSPNFEFNSSVERGARREELVITEGENALYPIIKLDGVNYENENSYTLDISNFATFDDSFVLTLSYVATENNGNEYYLDSHEASTNFNRLNYPRNLEYNNGNLSFDGDEQSEYYTITITLVNSSNGNYYYTFNEVDVSLDLQQLIDTKWQEDASFATAYRQAENVQVQIFAYANEETEDAYYLPSFYGTTVGGANVLTLYRLEEASLTFDPNTLIISWEQVAPNTTYDIYVDGVCVKENFSGEDNNSNISLNISDLGDIDFLTAKEIFVIGNNSGYLNSSQSNTITIKQLASIANINVINNNGQYSVSFNINSDLSNTNAVYVNGSSEHVNYIANQNSGNFDLSDFLENDFTLQVIASNSEGDSYYINSQTTNFNLGDLNDVDFEVTLSENILSWNRIVSDFVGNNIDPIIYVITINNNDHTYTISTSQTSYNLQDIEEGIGGIVLSGDIDITVRAEVANNYSLSLSNGQAKGYFGSKQSDIIESEKLSSISEISYTINDGEDESLLNQKKNVYVELSWQDEWTDKENISFEVTIHDGDSKQIFIVSDGSISTNYSLVKEEENYILTLQNTALGSKNISIDIRVLCENYVTSQPSTIDIERLNQIESASLDQEGVLTIVDEQNCSYIMQISIADRLIEERLSFDSDEKSIDLMVEGMLEDVYGQYTITILSYDENGTKLPSNNTYLVTGTKLQGIVSSEIDNYGFVNLLLYSDDFTNLVFTARTLYNGNYITCDVMPVATESFNVYRIYLPSLIESFSEEMFFQEGNYTFEITVREQGYVRSDYYQFSFDYTIEQTLPTLIRQDYVNDYITLNVNENDDTVGVTLKVRYSNDLTEESVAYFTYDASDIRGYIYTTENGERYFSTEMDTSLDVVSYIECYAINLNEMLSNYDFGYFEIEIVRVGRDDIVNIYDPHNFEFYKLNRVIDDVENEDLLHIDGNNLVWRWIAESNFASIDDFNATAYYVTFESIDDNESFRVLTFSSALDLSSIDLVAGKAYYITVTALSSANNILASNESQNSLQTLRYTQPLPIEVVEGKIVFDQNAFLGSEFMQDIISYFNESNPTYSLFYTMGEKNYTLPYYFNLSLFASQMITLHFTALDSTGAETSVSYDMTIPGYILFPDIEIQNNNSSISTETSLSYIELLQEYADTLQGSTEDYAIYFRQMAQSLSEIEYNGLSSWSMLFDDYGRTIPAGQYAVSLRHEGGDGRYINSSYSQSTNIYITAAPSVTLSQQSDRNNNYYMATFGNTQTYIKNDGGIYTRDYVTSYKLILRENADVGTTYNESIVFDIVYSDSQWNIFYGGQNLSGVISNVDLTGMPGFEINMTILREQYDAISDTPLAVNTLFRVDVVSSSSDNGYVSNGKSAVFYVRYLDLPTDSITFQDGRMTIRTNLESSSSILMRYLAVGSEVESMLIPINNGIANIDLPREGQYQYIILSLNGSISYNTMNVESKSYATENVYKLSSPELTSQNNNLYIQYNSTDFSYTQDQSLHFMLANDVSIEEGDDYYYSSTITRGDRSYITYSVGAVDSEGNLIYPSELNAQIFYTYLLGNSGQIQSSVASGEISQLADYVWTFMALNADGTYSQAVMLFTSDISQINARMLSVVSQEPYISDGNIVWEADELPTLENGDILYQVEVLYYNRVVGDNELNTTYDYITRDTYYTNNTMLDAKYVSQEYDYYTISVSAVAGVVSDDDNRAITTIEDEKYLLVDSLYYEGGTTHVLKGRTMMLGTATQPISRTETPILSPSESITNNGVSDGNIVYFITTDQYGGEVINDSSSQDVSSRTLISATYSQSGQNVTVLLSGSFTYSLSSSSSTSEQGRYIMVVFTPDEGQLEGVTTLSVSVQMYSETGLLSKALVIDNIYRLSNFTESYYDILLSGEQTVLDFTNYFRYVTIAGSSSNYQIVISYTTTTNNYELIITRDSPSKLFTITDNMLNVTVQARDNQTASTTNRLKILYSDSLEFVVQTTNVNEDGQDLINITWDSELYRFVWNWTNGEEEDNYEYYVELVMDNSQEITEVTSNNYYMPTQRGTITSFSVRARQISQVGQGGEIELYIFSQAVNYTSGNIEYTLFSGGDGTEEDPYRISTDEDFYNISKRNVDGGQFYFILTNNITIDNDMLEQDGHLIMEIFYGNLDGNDYTITINADRMYDFEGYRENITGIGTISFEQYFSIFREIALNASINNVNIDFIIDTTTLEGSNLIISPLALENYGSLNNITISNISLTRLQGSGTINNVFVGGIVGINYGTISSSSNNASFTYNMPQLLNVNFGYGAIAVINTSEAGNSGVISNTFNNGNVSVNVQRANVNIYLSGIVINNYSSLSMVGNNGNFTQLSTVTNASYFTGISLLSNGGSISYAFNNGLFTSSSSTSQNFAGISYTLESGQINYLADTSGYAIARISQSSPQDNGVNYASVSSGTVSNISTSSLGQVDIDIGNGYHFIISLVNESYFATIE